MKISTLFFLLFISFNSFTQVEEINFGKISNEILIMVNRYRDSIKVQPLKNHVILEAAAKDQADYNNWNNTLGHDQSAYNKQSPSSRVFFYGGNFNYIGENVALTGIVGSNKKRKSNLEIATELFTSWMESPPHKKNISNENYYQSGIALSYDEKKGQLYATQVFSALGYNFKPSLTTPLKAYGVQSYNEQACEDMKNFRYGTLTFANGIFTKGDSIFIKYHSLSYFNKVIHGPNDGYAIDIVFKDQLPCNSPNLFHGSEIFDGYMLAPKFRYELLSENRSEHPEKLITYLGLLPPNLPKHELNLILIRDNHQCDYSYPMMAPNNDIPPFYIPPVTLDQKATFTPFSIDTIIDINYSFLRSSSEFFETDYYSQIETIQMYLPFVKKIEIQTYSSIEGKEWFNDRIQQERAEQIKNTFMAYDFHNTELFETKAHENWRKFKEQQKEIDLPEFNEMSKLEIKRYLKFNNIDGKYDSLLFEQRRSVARVHIKGEISNTNDPYNNAVSWNKALDDRNIDLATMLLQKTIESEEYPLLSLNDLRIDSTYYENKAFATNALALKIKTKSRRLSDNFSNTKILNLDLESKENSFYATNWVNLYYHDLYRISRQYFNNPKKDAPPISPEKVFEILDLIDHSHFQDSTYLNRIKLNHALSSIHYYAWINNYSLVNKYFTMIFDYFYHANLPIEEATDLALYANHFHKYDKCVQMLDFYYDQNLLDERGSFVLAQTATLIQKELDEDDVIGYMNKAIAFNKKRWCNWLNRNFQVRRNERIKAIYCETCL